MNIPALRPARCQLGGSCSNPLTTLMNDIAEDTRIWVRIAKVQAFLCFQIIKDVSSTVLARPLCLSFDVICLASSHWSTRVSPGTRPPKVAQIEERTSCQITLENRQSAKRYCIVSKVWPRNKQAGLCGKSLRARCCTVQQQFIPASQKKILTFHGAQDLQVSFQA